MTFLLKNLQIFAQQIPFLTKKIDSSSQIFGKVDPLLSTYAPAPATLLSTPLIGGGPPPPPRTPTPLKTSLSQDYRFSFNRLDYL